ncbi:MAG: class I SAM-dependent methyltransferase [Acidobacteriota bacterium]
MLAVDLSEAMQSEARARLRSQDLANVSFIVGDAVTTLLRERRRFDRVFSSWVLGYIRLAPFFAAASRALAPDWTLYIFLDPVTLFRLWLQIRKRSVFCGPSAKNAPGRGWLRGYR